MKPLADMTPVELLTEFNLYWERWRSIEKARAQGGGIHDSLAGRFYTLTEPGRYIEVRVPSEDEERRWYDLCATINRRFGTRDQTS